jgi:hypothetical protein
VALYCVVFDSGLLGDSEKAVTYYKHVGANCVAKAALANHVALGFLGDVFDDWLSL